MFIKIEKSVKKIKENKKMRALREMATNFLLKLIFINLESPNDEI